MSFTIGPVAQFVQPDPAVETDVEVTRRTYPVRPPSEFPRAVCRPLPNTFLIGSMKSGTTYLSEVLRAHPDVFMSSPKEPCHFVDPKALRKTWRIAWQHGYWRSRERYLSLFARAEGARVVAEASTVYTQAPRFANVPERILDFNPEARFVYLLRDPLERTVSHYWHRVRWWGERRPIMEAIRGDSHYVDVSHYKRQLDLYLRHVSRDRIYVLAFEDFLADPLGELRSLFSWLRIDSEFRPDDLSVSINSTPEVVEQARGFGVLDRVRKHPSYVRIGSYIPHAARAFGARLAVRAVRPADVRLGELRSYLRPIQQAQTAELERLLGRTFPKWTTLYGTD